MKRFHLVLKITLCNRLGMFKVVLMSSCFEIHNCYGTEYSKHFMHLVDLCILQHSVVFPWGEHLFIIGEVVNCETIYLVYKKVNHIKFLMHLVPAAAISVWKTFCITCQQTSYTCFTGVCIENLLGFAVTVGSNINFIFCLCMCIFYMCG